MDMEGCRPCETFKLSSALLDSSVASSFSGAGLSSFGSSVSALVDASASDSALSSFFFAGPVFAFSFFFFNCSYCISGQICLWELLRVVANLLLCGSELLGLFLVLCLGHLVFRYEPVLLVNTMYLRSDQGTVQVGADSWAVSHHV